MLCIKDYKTSNNIFKKDSIYNVTGLYGDPQGAIEKYGMYDYVPIVCISKVVISDENEQKFTFRVTDFLNYFDIPEYMNDTKKFNI